MSELTEVLRGGRQCDEDGVEIIMSREACCVAADTIESLQQENATLKEQNALLTVQVQLLRGALEQVVVLDQPKYNYGNCAEVAKEAISALSAQD